MALQTGALEEVAPARWGRKGELGARKGHGCELGVEGHQGNGHEEPGPPLLRGPLMKGTGTCPSAPPTTGNSFCFEAVKDHRPSWNNLECQGLRSPNPGQGSWFVSL